MKHKFTGIMVLKWLFKDISEHKNALVCRIICSAILLVQGCANPTDLSTRSFASVATKKVISIGVVHSSEDYCRNSLVEFFRIHNIEIGFEGSVAYDVLVLREDFEKALSVLSNKWPPPSYCFTPYKWVGKRDVLKDKESN